MMISGYKSSERQPLLWDEPLGNHGHVRTVIGDLMEDLTALILGGRRHKTSAGCYCPDVSVGEEQFFESKAAGRNGQTFVYAGRLVKDRHFAFSGRRLSYVVWHHRANTLEVSTEGELRRLVLESTEAVYLVPFAEIDRVCLDRPAEPLNSAYGSTDRKTYGSGHRIPVLFLKSWMLKKFSAGVTEDEMDSWPLEDCS